MASQDGAVVYEIETPGGGAEYTPDVGFTTVGAAPTSVEAGLLIDALEQFWTDELAPITGDHWGLKRIRLYDHRTSPASWKFQRIFTGAGIEGDVTGAKLPDQLCLVTSLYTSLAGRSRQGRVYQGGKVAAQLATNANFVLTAHATAQNDAWQAFNTSLGATPTLAAFHSVWSELLAGSAPVTTYVTGERVDVQRRRAPQVR